MPGIVRKLLVFAAVDGLVLQPLAQRNNQRPAPALKIDYQGHVVGPFLKDVQFDTHKNDGLEIFGVIGLLKLANSAFLVSISNRQHVAQILGKPIYVITGVSIIPIESQAKAQSAIESAKVEIAELLDREEASDELLIEPENDTVTSEDEQSFDASVSTDRSRASITDPPRKNSIAEDVIGRKGVYGRFADRWFSRRGWTTGQRRNQGMSSEDELAYPDRGLQDDKIQDGSAAVCSTGCAADAGADAYQRWPQTPLTDDALETASLGARDIPLTASLLPKLVNTTKLLFASKTFFFSYDYDITHSLATQSHMAPLELPLFKVSDPEYFWNHHLSYPFIEKGFSEHVLPIMQGFVGQREFALEWSKSSGSGIATLSESTPTAHRLGEASAHIIQQTEADSKQQTPDEKKPQGFLLTLISRRSVHRSGLRYLRRGIDEDGHTANSVETEQLLSYLSWNPEGAVHSFVQTRGSIPLFFSQIPYNFKPPPTLHASPEANTNALTKHFSNLMSRYGDVQAISLVDKHGTEVTIGNAYEKYVKTLNENGGIGNKTVAFEWFEFHSACRGMKFENVSILVESMYSFLTSKKWTSLQSNKVLTSQSGIIRTNCMDCLDRTNVVQSAFAQRILELQLASVGFSVNFTSDPSTTWFNTLWADNGDAISRAYTGTSALKGDYTRTRKRNMVGALTDLSLTLTRYYRNLFDDFFAQAAIDYLLGTVTSDVFAEFEATMTTVDPAIDMRKARQAAIATASNVVVEDTEDLLHGWALRTPALPNTLRTFPFTEALLLLTDKALYNVRFDWNASKVRSFERIDLNSVESLQHGTYITETHAQTQTDPDHNVGFIIRYHLFLPDSDSENEIDGKNGDDRSENNEDGNSSEVVNVNARPFTTRRKTRPSIIRVNTRTLENVRDAWSITGADGRHEHFEDSGYGNTTNSPNSSGSQSDVRLLAFKALPLRSAVVRQHVDVTQPISERESVRDICAEISRAVNSAQELAEVDNARQVLAADLSSVDDETVTETESKHSTTGLSRPIVVEEKDIIGINEAQASTGYFERVGWGIKKAIWG